MPTASKAKNVFENGKTTSYHIKSIASCQQSAKSSALKLILARGPTNKRGDFEADGTKIAGSFLFLPSYHRNEMLIVPLQVISCIPSRRSRLPLNGVVPSESREGAGRLYDHEDSGRIDVCCTITPLRMEFPTSGVLIWDLVSGRLLEQVPSALGLCAGNRDVPRSPVASFLVAFRVTNHELRVKLAIFLR